VGDVTGLDLKAALQLVFEYDVQTAVQDGATDFGPKEWHVLD